MSLEKIVQLTDDVNDVFEAMLTHLQRSNILHRKIVDCVPSQYLEEYGEFLIDWGNTLTKFVELDRERIHLLYDMVVDDKEETEV